MCITKKSWPSSEGLKIGYLNINSARNKTDEIASILHNDGSGFHLFCFAESRLSQTILDSEIFMPGYDIVRLDTDPHNPKLTGLLVYCSKVLSFNRVSSFESFDIESVWFEIKIKHNSPILIGYVYRNPAEHIDWYDRFFSLLDAVFLENKETIIMGDFNIDLLKSNSKWDRSYSMYNLEQLIDCPTRVTATSETLIDHIYVNTKQNIHEVCCPPSACSDHFPICLTWTKKKCKNSQNWTQRNYLQIIYKIR